MTYLVVLKLAAPEDTYTNLIQYLKNFGYWARPLPGVWLIKSGLYSGEIRDEILRKIRGEDKVLVIEANNNWGSYNLDAAVAEWMKKNL